MNKIYTEEQLIKICHSVAEKAMGTSLDVEYIKTLCEDYSDHHGNIDILYEISKLDTHKSWKYPMELSVDSINAKLQEIGVDEDISEDWNGHDLDWSIIDPFEYNSMEFEIWGCATSGSFMFQRRK